MSISPHLRLLCTAMIIGTAAVLTSCKEDRSTGYYFKCDAPEDINDFMSKDRPIISGHRGGNMPGYPENCIETFGRILEDMPTFFEVDPRMTKDSIIVLMHDATIDRTTTGKGKVRDYTYAELQQFNLVDRWGAATQYRIPSVSDVVRWSRDKVILNFDIKDVTRDVLVPLVDSLGGVNCIYTVRNAEEALEVYRLDSTARMSAWVRDLDQLDSYRKAGIPMENIALAYVVSDIMKDSDKELYEALRKEGIACMVSTSPKQDKAGTAQERLPLFKEVLGSGPDIIETDFPLEFLEAKRQVQGVDSKNRME